MTVLTRDENTKTVIGGADSVTNKAEDLIKDSTSHGLWVHVTGNDLLKISSYLINDLDDGDTTSNILYIGLEDPSGNWCVSKFDETTQTLPTKQYATVDNNSSTTTYSDAWTNRATLTYNDYSVVF